MWAYFGKLVEGWEPCSALESRRLLWLLLSNNPLLEMQPFAGIDRISRQRAQPWPRSRAVRSSLFASSLVTDTWACSFFWEPSYRAWMYLSPDSTQNLLCWVVCYSLRSCLFVVEAFPTAISDWKAINVTDFSLPWLFYTGIEDFLSRKHFSPLHRSVSNRKWQGHI